MNRWMMTGAVAMLCAALISAGASLVCAQSVPIYTDQGGAKRHYGSGAEQVFESGSTHTQDAGATSDLSGTNNLKSGATLNAKSGSTHTIEVGAALAVNGKLTTKLLTVTVETTLTAAQSGATVIFAGVDGRVNLPATAEGLQYTITQNASSTTSGLRVFPVAGDKIIGASIASPADAKSIINTPATDNPGDSITVVGDGVDGWQVKSVTGTWAKEP